MQFLWWKKLRNVIKYHDQQCSNIVSFSALCREAVLPWKYSIKVKIGIKCFSRFLLVAPGRKPSKPHFHGPIRRRISEEDRRNVRQFFPALPTFLKRNQDKKLLEISRIFWKESTHQMFGYLGIYSPNVDNFSHSTIGG